MDCDPGGSSNYNNLILNTGLFAMPFTFENGYDL